MSESFIVVAGFHDAFHAPVWRAIFDRAASVEAIVGDIPQVAPRQVKWRAHSYQKLALYADYGVDRATLQPLDAQTVESYAATEVQFLRMSDRLELLSPAPYHQRKTLYLAHLQYWSHRLTRQRPKAALFSNVPHEMHDFVLYDVCKRLGIATLVFSQAQVEDTFIACEDWRDPIPEAAARLTELERIDGELQGRFRRHYETQTSYARDPVPFYMHTAPPSVLRNVREAAALAMRPGVLLNRLRLSARRAPLELATRRIRAQYDRLTTEPRLDEPYVYLALHYQPEMTTSPCAGAFVDQSLIVEMLAAALGTTCKLLVKEHPKQTAVARDGGEYQRWAALPNVTLVPRETSTFGLIRGAKAVATCTGTVGWEALFRERPVLLFGRYFYQYARGVHSIRTVDDLARALTAIETDAGRPSLRSTAAFLRLLDERTHEGYVDGGYRAVSRLDPERSGQAIADVVGRWLDARGAA